MKLGDEQLRALGNAAQFYADWRAAHSQIPTHSLYWNEAGGHEYLASTSTAQRSFGKRSPETEQMYEEHTAAKQVAQQRFAALEARINESAPLWRALRLPSVDALTGRILRELDKGELLGSKILIIGTYALKAYEVEAADTFATGMDATEDLDVTLLLGDPTVPRDVLRALKRVDKDFIVSPNTPTRVVNTGGYRVDLLTTLAAKKNIDPAFGWRPAALEGQDWLLLGRPVNTVIVDARGWPVPIIVPDPRYFALHKRWLSKRRPGPKRAKDERQGQALLEAVRANMPHYPMDDAFLGSLPLPLRGPPR
jgi:hypothetical protein